MNDYYLRPFYLQNNHKASKFIRLLNIYDNEYILGNDLKLCYKLLYLYVHKKGNQ